MSINKKNIVILVEHKIRELNPNIFLATKLVKKGFRVYIGNWLSVDRILKYFDKGFELVSPGKKLQKNSVNKAIKFVKMGKVREAEKVLKPAVNYLIKIKCKKIILGCTELPIAIFAYKSFKKIRESKIFIDPNLLLAQVSMKKYLKK